MIAKIIRERLYLQALGALLLYLGGAILLTLPLAPRMAATIYNYGDTLVHTWKIGWDAYQLINNPLALYSAPVFYPYSNTLAFSNNFITQALLALPVIFATGNYPLALNFNVLLTFVLNGLGMYLLLRDWRANWAGAFIGGFIFAFGHYHLSHVSQLGLLSSEWMPFTLLYLGRTLRTLRGRDFFLFGMFLWLSVNSAVYYAFFTTAIVLVYGAFLFILHRVQITRRAVLGIGAAAVSALVLTVPFMLPYVQLSSTLDLRRDLSELLTLSAVPLNYFSAVSKYEPFASLSFPMQHAEAALSPGILAWLLGVYALTRREWRVPIIGFLAIGLVGLVLSFGVALQLGSVTIPMPYQFLYDYVPGIANSMRVTARWGVVVLLAMSAIAGLGFSALVTRTRLRWKYTPLLLTCMVLVVFGVEYDQAPLRLMTGTLLRQVTPPVYDWLRQQPDAAVIELPIGPITETYSLDTWYQYYTLIHHHRIVNGNAGFSPPTYPSIVKQLAHFPSADAIDLARALNVRYVIVHTDQISDWLTREPRANLFPDALKQVEQFGTDLVYEITPGTPEQNPQLTLRAPATMLADSAAPAYLVADPTDGQNEIFSRNGVLDLDLTWYKPDGSAALHETQRVRSRLLRNDQGAVLPIELHAPVQAQSNPYRLVIRLKGLSAPQTVEQAVVVQAIAEPDDSAEAVQLVNAVAAQRAARAGESLAVTLTWRVLAPMSRDYNVFIHVNGADGKARAELDAQPYLGNMPTSQWQPGQTIVEQYFVPILPGVPQGMYSLVVGLADPQTSQPIPILAADNSVETALSLDVPAYIGKGWEAAPLSPRNSLQVDFGDWARLAGYDLAAKTFAPGDTVALVLYWIGREHNAADYTVFLHLLNQQGQIVAQADASPMQGHYPTSVWNDGEWIRDVHRIALPDNLPPGQYTIEIGFYEPASGERVLLQNGDAAADHLSLATVQVK